MSGQLCHGSGHGCIRSNNLQIAAFPGFPKPDKADTGVAGLGKISELGPFENPDWPKKGACYYEKVRFFLLLIIKKKKKI